MADWTYPDGYDPHGGYLDRVTFVVYPPEDEQLGLQALQANIIYAWDERVSAEDIVELEATPGVEVTTEPGDMYRIFNINCGRFPTNITAFRRAFVYALDKFALSGACAHDLAFPQACALPLAFGNWTYESVLPETYYDRDITAAEATLEAAGFRDLDGNGWRDYDADNSTTLTPGDILDIDFEIEVYHATGYAHAGYASDIAVQSLHSCGIMATGAHIDYYQMWDWILAGYFWIACSTMSDMSRIDLLYDLFHSSSNKNQWYLGGWTNATYDAAAESLMAASTEDEANNWAWECQRILWHAQPMIICYNDVYTHAYRTERWEGYINRACRNRIGNGYSLVHISLKEEYGGPFGCYPTEYIMSLSGNLDTTNYLWSNSKYTKKVMQLVYEGLWTISPYDWTPQPSLAYAWDTEPTVASGDIQDGEKYTFYLYENATWHDGTPVTATDVANSVSLVLQDPFDAENYENIYLIRVNDSQTIEIFTNATGYFEWTRATGFTVFPHHIWSNDTITGGNISTWVPTVADLVGSGPYSFLAHVPGQYVVLERHPDWHFAIPHPPRIPCGPIDGPPWPPIQLFLAIIFVEVVILTVLLSQRRKKSPS
jgi:ABC-type transport system substrate-binding protein